MRRRRRIITATPTTSAGAAGAAAGGGAGGGGGAHGEADGVVPRRPHLNVGTEAGKHHLGKEQ